MKIVLSQLNYHIGDLAGNYAKIELAVERAIDQKADLIIFSELAICGYPPRDMLDYPGFMDNVESYLKQLAQLSQRVGILI